MTPMTRQQSRRRFLAEMAGGAVAMPVALGAQRESNLPPVRPSSEEEWTDVRRLFSFAESGVPMNAANLCPSPRTVAERVTELSRDVDRDCSSQNRRKFRDLLEASRHAVARGLGVTADEIALVRNTSEANNIINNGLSLEAGDEVVIWDQNHPTNNVAWEVRAARFGFAVIRVSTPRHPASPDDLLGPFARAITPRTRVLAVTHASNVSGVRLPVAELGEIAHQHDIHVHVDGAQSWGVLDVDLTALGCDSFTASAHKWFLGPREVGLLYVRAERIPSIWPGVVAPSWGGNVEPRVHGARRLESMGQRDDAALAAIATAADFHAQLGAAGVEARVTQLASHLKEGLRDAGFSLVTPLAPELSAGVCIAEVDGGAGSLVDALYTDHGIAGAATGGLRLCPHVYNTVEHVDRAIRGARLLRDAARSI